MKKIIKLLLTVCFLFTLFACAREEKKPELKDDIHIFFTSDVHCGVSDNLGYPKLKALIEAGWSVEKIAEEFTVTEETVMSTMESLM